MENMGLISLILLFVVIVIGFLRKTNVGILAIAASLIVGRLAGITDKEIISGFSSSLFIMLAGVTYLFSIVNVNGTLELSAKKIVSVVGKRTWLIPIVVFIVGFIIPAVGPGAVPALAIMPAFSVPLALVIGVEPIMLGLIGVIGLFGGRMTAITPEGILIADLASKQGVTGVIKPLLLNATFTSIILSVIVYVYYKGYKPKNQNILKASELPKFNKNQIITIIGVLAMLFIVLILKINVGLASFLIGSILMVLNVADEAQSIKNIPWSVILLITGVGLFMEIVVKLGGINILATALSSIMGPRTAGPIMGITGGMMSWFSSALGVVYPTLIPTVGTIIETVGGSVTATELISTIGIAASVAGLSPASSGGALILAAIVANTECSKEEQNKIFVELFIWSVFSLALVAFIGLLGGYRIIK
ncbi:hypothetical protein HYG84_00450 [Alkaliphilus sp. B6464]|nr:hypothetical protein HYG84_00450 [Alkaliphilus sp. B6464]